MSELTREAVEPVGAHNPDAEGSTPSPATSLGELQAEINELQATINSAFQDMQRPRFLVPTTTAVDGGAVAALVDDAGDFLIEPGAPIHLSNGKALPQSSSHPDAFEPESRQHLSAARELMLKSKGYADRPGRRPSTNRLLMKNFGQRPPIDNTEEFRANHERIFGTERPALNPGKREGYTVRTYKPSVLPEIINNDPHGYDRLDEQKESDE